MSTSRRSLRAAGLRDFALKSVWPDGSVFFAAHFFCVGCLAQHMNSRSFGNIKPALVTCRQPSVPSCVRLKRLITQAQWFGATTARFLNNFSETSRKLAVSSPSAGNSKRSFEAGAAKQIQSVAPLSELFC